MTQSSAVNDRIEVHSSRLWALIHFNMTLWVFPTRVVADHVGVSNNVVLFWLTPWRRTDEHLPMSHIAEVNHTRGLIWDQISVESSGGLNPLVISGLPKGQDPTVQVPYAGLKYHENLPTDWSPLELV